MERNKGKPKYHVDNLMDQEIVIACNTKEEWDKVTALMSNNRLKDGNWERYKDRVPTVRIDKWGGTYGYKSYYQKTAGYENWKIIEASDVIAANEPELVYKVGDWIVVLDGGCRVGPGHEGYKLVGNTYKISKASGATTHSNWEYEIEGKPFETRAIRCPVKDGHMNYIRRATQAEIAQATGQQWKVGDKLPVEWLQGQQTYLTDGRHHSKGLTNGRDRTVVSVDNKGRAKISDTCTVWLPPKHECSGYQDSWNQKEESDVNDYKVGDWLYVLNSGCGCSGYKGMANNLKNGDVLEVLEIRPEGEYNTATYRTSKGWISKGKNGSRPAKPHEIPKKEYVWDGDVLPDSYWIENPNPGHATDEWIRLWKQASDGDTAQGAYRWYNGGKKRSREGSYSEKPSDGLPVVPYNLWKELLEGKQVPVTKAAWAHEWHIGDKYQANAVGMTYTIGELLNPNTVWIHWEDGKTTYMTETVDKFWNKVWIPIQPENVPVTQDNVYIGMKVVRGKDWDKSYGIQEGKVGSTGKVIDLKSSLGSKWVEVRWEENGHVWDYKVGHEDKYDLYIAPSQETTTKQIVNKTTKTTENGNSKEHQQQSYTGTAVKLSANSSTVCRSDRGATTPVRYPGQSVKLVRGHRSNSKAVSIK